MQLSTLGKKYTELYCKRTIYIKYKKNKATNFILTFRPITLFV
nr:MAG TPA: hypothetical protein [Ackermannviridae sp.]DAW82321.1 MAG TPA: hypothetical protein [Bacteriophage sp.]